LSIGNFIYLHRRRVNLLLVPRERTVGANWPCGALSAPRWLRRQLLIETAVLGLLGGAAAVVAVAVGTSRASAPLPFSISRPGVARLDHDLACFHLGMRDGEPLSPTAGDARPP
jgi:hypothetical protein